MWDFFSKDEDKDQYKLPLDIDEPWVSKADFWFKAFGVLICLGIVYILLK